MIPQLKKSDIQVSSNIQTFNATIDSKNIEHIITILSSNLYSAPERSFIRETVSNAWDSHVEAGTTDIPIIVVLNPNDISIRDFGTGLSPQRFEEVYCSIGSSTKRTSNDYIGMFGLGRFSGLACSNTVYITSYYEGIVYYYVMIKAGNNITINLLNTSTTEEKNGVEISIKNIKDTIENYVKVLDSICFFPNIYIKNNYTSRDFNIKTQDCGDYFCRDFDGEYSPYSSCIAIGYNLYPLSSCIEDYIYRHAERLFKGGVVVKINAQDIEVTPNRENIIYTNATIELVEKRIEEVYHNIMSKIHNLGQKDYSNIVDYCKDAFTSYQYIPMENTITKGYNSSSTFPHIYIDSSEALKTFITYKHRNYKNWVANRCSAVISDIVSTLCKRKVGTPPSNCIDYIEELAERRVFMYTEDRVNNAVIDFIKQYYSPSFILLKNKTFDEFRVLCLTSCTATVKENSLTEDLISSLREKIVFIDKANAELGTFLAENKQEKKKKKEPEKIIIKRNNTYEHYDSTKDLISYCRRARKPLYIGTADMVSSIMSTIKDGISFLKINVGIVSMPLYTKLILKNSPCILSIDTLIKSKKIIEYYSIIKALPKYKGYFSTLSMLKNVLSESYIQNYKNIFSLLYHVYARYSTTHPVHCPDIELDSDITAFTEKILNFATKYDDLLSQFPYVDSSILIMLLIRTKAFRLNYTVYKQTKQSSLIKMLCKK